MLIYSCMAQAGDWKAAWRGTVALNETAFLDAGGNGHSLTNTLWYIATRPEHNATITSGSKIPPVEITGRRLK